MGETPGTPQLPRRVALSVCLYVAEVVRCSGTFPRCQKAMLELTKVNTYGLITPLKGSETVPFDYIFSFVPGKLADKTKFMLGSW